MVFRRRLIGLLWRRRRFPVVSGGGSVPGGRAFSSGFDGGFS